MRRSSVLIRICAGVLIAATLFVASSALGTIIGEPWNVSAILGALCVLPWVLPFGFLQYLAVFRANAGAAKWTGVLCLTFSTLLVLILAITVRHVLTSDDSISNGKRITFTLAVVAIATIAAVVGVANLRHARELRKFTEKGPQPLPSRGPFTIRELLLAIVAISVMLAVTAETVRSSRPRFAEHVLPADAALGIPEGATDVCYFRSGHGGDWFEFTIDESSFRRWCTENAEFSDSLVEPVAAPITVSRYCDLIVGHSGPTTATVATGYFCRNARKYGRGVAVFDATTGRAYFDPYPQ